eukprot:CAMPEP_0180572186 /NCGR_PEP_ID=MMETSP1037_2-20121125/9118_1 /TAXON_ID=632150 /ORGANISM="Azadinium spinosum, Strain 3D9" /LENGTH=40 /DNA_ID= /DNA_START= /DNA_END= /DNA_ORIENTATION=
MARLLPNQFGMGNAPIGISQRGIYSRNIRCYKRTVVERSP